MLVHLATLNDPYLDQPAAAFAGHASTDRVGAHALTDSPELADIILFTQCHMLLGDWRLRTIRGHPLTRAFPEKVMIYNECDRPWCALPGVYVNMPKGHFVVEHQRPWGYFVPAQTATHDAPDLLFSFMGSNTASCRGDLFALRHPDAIVEEVHGFRFWDAASEGFEERRARFRSTLARSRYVLCPRGNGTSSVRLYEVLAAGAVPVIISDDWVPPVGPPWEQFSIRWPEGQIAGLTDMLTARDADWAGMREAALRAHAEFFSSGVYFHHVARLCAELLRSGSTTSFPARGVVDRHFASLAAANTRERIHYALTVLRRKVKSTRAWRRRRARPGAGW
jgi:hypothetical protein